MAIMLITHAMGVVAETAQRVVVMYAGKVVEEAPVERLFANPRHPYTQGLIRSIPRIDTRGDRASAARGDRRRGAKPDRSAAGLPLRAALPLRRRRAAREAVPALRDDRAAGHKVACVAALQDGRSRAMTEPLLRVKDLVKHFPVKRRRVSAARSTRCTRSTASASRSAPARRSAWSANPAAASRPPAAASCG